MARTSKPAAGKIVDLGPKIEKANAWPSLPTLPEKAKEGEKWGEDDLFKLPQEVVISFIGMEPDMIAAYSWWPGHEPLLCLSPDRPEMWTWAALGKLLMFHRDFTAGNSPMKQKRFFVAVMFNCQLKFYHVAEEGEPASLIDLGAVRAARKAV